MGLRIQRPTDGYDWLYNDRSASDRYFTKFVILGAHESYWEECTNENKEDWEREHPMPEYGDND